MLNKKNQTIVIFGSTGMLGNAIFKYLQQSNFNIISANRDVLKNSDSSVFFDVELSPIIDLEEIFRKFSPNYIINCIGYIRPRESDSNELLKSLSINSIFPKRLSIFARKYSTQLIHFSTDCVFDGKSGPYDEFDIPNELGIYGLSKFLGEVKDFSSLTIRTSIIGKELNSQRNLLDWFLEQEGVEINGYSKVLWNGVTTLTAAKIVKRIIDKRIRLKHPLIQISGDTVNKYELLCIFKDVFQKSIIINKSEIEKSDKTLIKSKEQDIYFKDLIVPIKDQIIELKKFYDL